MRQFRLVVATSAAVFAVACSDEAPSSRTDVGDTADETDSDTDADSDSDTDTDADSDSDTNADGAFEAVVDEWCEVGTTSCAILNSDGEILAGVGTIASTSEDGEFPITFTATQVSGEGAFDSTNSAWATLYFGDSSVTAYFERSGD